jgi:hypothetical protein
VSGTTFKALLEQERNWVWNNGEEKQLGRLADMSAEHMVRLRDWLLNHAVQIAPAEVDPVEWMRQRPLFRRLVRLIEQPGEEGVLVTEIFTASDLAAIKRQLSKTLSASLPESEQAAIKRVLWKISDYNNGNGTGNIAPRPGTRRRQGRLQRQ